MRSGPARAPHPSPASPGAGNLLAALVPFLAAVPLTLSGCAPSPEPGRPQAAPPTVRFVCAEGCESFKTVRAGETPPPCCGSPMISD